MKSWRPVIGLFVVALLFRVVISLIFSNEIVVGSDQMNEITLGRRLAEGNIAGVLDTYWAPAYPFTIGILSIFIDSVVYPALLVSIFSGAIAVPLTYIIAIQSYGMKDAWIAAAIAMFFPHLINSVIGLGSENLYIVLMLGSLIMAWEAIKKNSIWTSIAAGLLLGLAYLTRPEAIGYLAFFGAAFVGSDMLKGRSVFRDALPKLLAFALTTVIFAAPYIFYLHSQTGTWSVSGKAQVNTLAGHISDDSEIDEIEPEKADRPLAVFFKWFLLNLVESSKLFPILVPSLLLIFVGLGMFDEPWTRDRLLRESYLILFCLVTVVGYAAAVVQLRYFYVILPMFFCWIARGSGVWSKWLKFSLPKTSFWRIPSKRTVVGFCLAAIFFYVMPLNFYMRSAEDAWSTRAYEERDAGNWIRENTATDSQIYAFTPRPAFYGQRSLLRSTQLDHDEIIIEAKSLGADYIVIGNRSLRRKSYLKGLDERLRSDGSFMLAYEDVRMPEFRISIYQLK
jgi:hypothetical protein